MNRKIKFRGRITKSTEWVYGSLIVYPDGEYNILSQRKENSSKMDDWCVDKQTVGQFTGLYDKNGQEVYEGDIVRYFKDELGIVKFVAGSFIIDGNTCYESFLELGGKIAIVGNIYENPDLLEEE